MLDAVRDAAPDAVLVAVSSGEVYGPPERLPVDESARLNPQNPYAVSKAATDHLAGIYAAAHGLRIVRPRAFNHAGPRQSPVYAIASFTRQVAAAVVAGDSSVTVMTGNADVRRDFTDVRDVVRAYRLLVDAAPGIFNVCSGVTASTRELVALIGEAAGVEVDHQIDPALVRGHEVAEIRGAHDRLTEATGWQPEIPLRQTLADALAWWVDEIRSGRAAGGAVHE